MTNHSSLHDLQHFLRLAKAQLKHRLTAGPNDSSGQELEPVTIRRMRILEELLKEQIPDENTRPATGPTR